MSQGRGERGAGFEIFACSYFISSLLYIFEQAISEINFVQVKYAFPITVSGK